MTTPDAWLSRTAIERELAAGAVVILATDTLPGLHARLDRPEALARLRKLKQRSEGKPFLVLAGSIAQARGLVMPASDVVTNYIEECWPGPFTLILNASAAPPNVVVAAQGTVAVRVPGDSCLRDLLIATGPLASTSANIAGGEPPTGVAAAAARFPELPAWRHEIASGVGAASALIDLSCGEPRLIRVGPLPPPAWPRSM